MYIITCAAGCLGPYQPPADLTHRDATPVSRSCVRGLPRKVCAARQFSASHLTSLRYRDHVRMWDFCVCCFITNALKLEVLLEISEKPSVNQISNPRWLLNTPIFSHWVCLQIAFWNVMLVLRVGDYDGAVLMYPSKYCLPFAGGSQHYAGHRSTGGPSLCGAASAL